MASDRAGRLLVEAREAAGLSRAELARRAGLSWDTVKKAEEGRDPRLSTLQALAEALPFLGPEALLGEDASSAPLASPSAWAAMTELYGFAARSVTLRVDVGADARRLRLDVAG